MLSDQNLVVSIKRALIGNAPEGLAEVRFKNGLHIVLEFVFDGPMGEEDREAASVVETEIIADTYKYGTSEGRFVGREEATEGLKVAARRPLGGWPDVRTGADVWALMDLLA